MLQYFNTKEKLNSEQALWYCCTSKSFYHIHNRLRFKIGKLDGISRRSREEKSRTYTHFFNKGHLIDLENDNVEKVTDAEDMELEGIDVAR